MIPFTKMHGAGNDYVYLDGFRHELPESPAELARQVSDRHTGIGSDGLIMICPADQADAEMIMYNADGSRAEMCGNGLRCVAKYLYDERICHRNRIRIQTGAGPLEVEVHPDEHDIVREVTVDMGRPVLEASKIPTRLGDAPDQPVRDFEIQLRGRAVPVTCVSMGNPHCVVFVDELSDAWVLDFGPELEVHPAFPNRVNVEFVQILSPTQLVQRTWERGSGETLACGTGASAVCVAGALTGRTEREVTIRLLGGELRLRWDRNSGHVFKTGPAERVFDGTWLGDVATPQRT